MDNSLQALGFTKEEIEQKVVEKIAADLMSEMVYDPETGSDVVDTHLARRFHEIIKTHVDRQLNKLAEEYVVPHVRELIESVSLQVTNQWGEKMGEPKTFIEYLTDSAQAYLQQPVDYQGKPLERNPYGSKEQTRLIHLVHEHLHYSIETAMKNAVEQVKAAIAPALEATVKIKLGEIANSIKVTMNSK